MTLIAFLVTVNVASADATSYKYMFTFMFAVTPLKALRISPKMPDMLFGYICLKRVSSRLVRKKE